MARRRRQDPHGRYQKRVEEETRKAAPLATAALGFVPGVGEAMDAKDALDAYAGGDYKDAAKIAATGLFGMLPVIGDSVATMARIKRAADKAGISPDEMKKLWSEANRLSPKERNQVLPLLDKDPKKARDILADMKLEAAAPALRETPTDVGGLQRVRKGVLAERPTAERPYDPRPGFDPLDYKAYETPEGDFVHATYTDHAGTKKIRNVMGGSEADWAKGKQAPTRSGQFRPTPSDFNVVTDKMVREGHPGPSYKLGQSGAKAPTKAAAPMADPRITALKEKGYSDAQIQTILKSMGG